MKILFFGDVNGKTGRRAILETLPELKEKHEPDLVLANVENLAHGKGVTLQTFEELLEAGVDFCTSGNHVFDKPEAVAVFERYAEKVIRPANFAGNLPNGQPLPGRGYHILDCLGQPVLIINLNGQVFMEKQFDFGQIENPFLKLNEILQEIPPEIKIRILDFHAEATSEKKGMGFWADGRLSQVVGTHTHVATADSEILPHGTGYLTDVGMVGAANNVIGVKKENAIKRMLFGPEPHQKIPLEVAESDDYEIGYLVAEIDESTGKCQNIKGFLEKRSKT